MTIPGIPADRPNGCVKTQLGRFYVIELVVGDDPGTSGHGLDAIGYALFDLQHRRLGPVYAFFTDVLAAAEALARAWRP